MSCSDRSASPGSIRSSIDRLKREFYGRLDELRRRESADFYSAEVHALVADIFPAEPSAGEIKHLHAYASGSWSATPTSSTG